MLALVWIAGPLSGALVQPYVGMKSDNCRISWGRRRPFIIGGAAATILCLMVLAWAREIMSGFLGLFGADSESWGVKQAVMIFAILFVYVLDFAINVSKYHPRAKAVAVANSDPVQAAIRAYIVDVAPTHQQESANAWMIRASGMGNIMGYLAGNANLPALFPWLGNSQFKVLCAIASFIMALTVAISCLAVSERNPRYAGEVTQQEGLLNFFRSLARSVRSLPLQIRKVCEVQFFAWIGWFPFLFYITTYIGEIYSEPFFERNPNMTDEKITEILEEGTRLGARALLIFSLTTFGASIVLPFVIPPTYIAPAPHPSDPITPLTPTTPRSLSASGYFAIPRTPRTPTTPHSLSASGYFAMKEPRKPRPKTTFMGRLENFGNALQIKSLTLRRSWFLSHIIFATLMALTFVVKSTLAATILVGMIGIPWALTNWAPFALISSEISKRDAMRRGLIRPKDDEAARVAAGADEAAEAGADQAGVVLGIHNVAIAAPQVIATLVSSVIFRLLQKPRGTPGDNSVAWVLRFGGCCALVAAWLTLRVGEEKEEEEDIGGRHSSSP
jgi:solute carrier family 45 protein 1/2/4